MENNMYYFYHVYADGNWRHAIDQQIKATKISGLMNKIDKIRIGVVGSDVNFNLVKEYLNNSEIDYEIINHSHYGWEQITQNKLYEFSKENDGIVFYGHTKAASRGGPGQNEWRETMIYYNIINWQSCIEALQTYDTAGCFWMTPLPAMTEHAGHKSFYAGTFWWAKLDYIRKLPPPNMEHRYRAEGWIGLSDEIRPFSFAPGWPGNWIDLSPYLIEK